MSLAESVKQTLKQQVAPDSKLVVAVSGGADSLALLHVLQATRAETNIRIHAATLDHGLRGEASAADADFVAAICQQWGIPVTRGALRPNDLPAGVGVENAARIARYNFLAQTAQAVDASVIAVAHHADDQAETVLLHLIRGAGLQGISGMTVAAPVPGHPALTLLRPLLHVTRHEIEAYCAEQGLQPRQDHTNQDTALLRNRIRLETLPHLRQINPNVSDALNRLAAAAALDFHYIEEQLKQAMADHLSLTPTRVALDRNIFGNLQPALQHHFIRWAAQQLDSPEVGYEHVVSAVAFILRGTTGQSLSLPGGLLLRLDYKTIDLQHADAPPVSEDIPLLPAGAVVDISVPGKIQLPDSAYVLEISAEPLEGAFRLSAPENATIQLRTRQQGDRFAPLGLSGHTQKVKKWMIDHKVRQALRDQVPMLTINGTIAAIIVGNIVVISEKFAVRQPDQSIIYVRFTKNMLS